MRLEEVGPRGTQVVGRVFDILEAVARSDRPITATEISRSVGLNYSTTYRILDAIVHRGMIVREADSRGYRIGPRLREFADASASRADVQSRARPFLEALTERVGEASHLAVLDEGEADYLLTVEGPRLLSQHSHVRVRVPVHSTGVGKALVAELPADALDGVIARGLHRYTRKTITERDRFLAELARVRKQGFAVDDEEMEDGLMCIAAPVRDRIGRVVAAISIGGPRSRIRELGTTAVAEHVRRSAADLGAALGWTGG